MLIICFDAAFPWCFFVAGKVFRKYLFRKYWFGFLSSVLLLSCCCYVFTFVCRCRDLAYVLLLLFTVHQLYLPMASPVKNYRKTCNRKPCRKKYKGTKQQKYCCASCRVMDCQEKNKVRYYPHLKRILALELSYLVTEDITKIVDCCLYCVQRWKKNKKDL